GPGQTPLEKARRHVAMRLATAGPEDRYAIIAAGAPPARLPGGGPPGPPRPPRPSPPQAPGGAARLAAGRPRAPPLPPDTRSAPGSSGSATAARARAIS